MLKLEANWFALDFKSLHICKTQQGKTPLKSSKNLIY